MIPLRERKRKKIKSKYRRKMIDEFEEILYHCRNLVETMFSVLKRKYGEEVKAKKYWNQAKHGLHSISEPGIQEVHGLHVKVCVHAILTIRFWCKYASYRCRYDRLYHQYLIQ